MPKIRVKIIPGNSCKCDFCRRNSAIEEVIKHGSKKKLRKALFWLNEAYINQSSELSMAEAYISDINADKEEKSPN